MVDHEFKLPHLRAWLKFSGKKSRKNVFYDTKFYPYAKSQHVFAAVGGSEVLICRPSTDKTNSLEVLSTIRDVEDTQISHLDVPPVLLNSCTWSTVDGKPLLCVAGWSGKVKVFDTLRATLEQTLVGHGSEINDLCTHPLYPHIVATGSADHSIRIWSLLPEHRKNPCLLILGHGQAHKEGILTCAFHQTGRYMISGGLDHMICLWTLPDLSPTTTQSWTETRVLHFPHFITQAVHGNFVDCVSFYGDLVLSKAAEEHRIILWMITGFSSAAPPPSPATAPVTNTFRDTRSGFLTNLVKDASAGDQEIPPFQRLLSLSAPESVSFYMRFSLLRPSPKYPNLHPMLAFMNNETKLFIWDLKRLQLGHDGEIPYPENSSEPKRKGRKKSFPFNLGPSAASPSTSSRGDSNRERSDSLQTETNASSSLPPEGQSTTATSIMSGALGPPPVPGVPTTLNERKYDISDPFKELRAHQSTTISKYPKHVTARQAAWSTDGRWLVIVGESEDDGVVALYSR